MVNVQVAGMTPDEYLEWEEHQELKHEYILGDVYAMAGGTVAHNDIVLNLYSLLRPHLRAKRCRANVADVKVKVSSVGPYFYSDLVVTCDDRDRQAVKIISYPRMIFEVLSPITAAFDRGDKFKFYRRVPTLQEYILVDGEKVGVDCYRKGGAGKWELTAYPEDAVDAESPEVELTSLELSLPLSLIYENVEFVNA